LALSRGVVDEMADSAEAAVAGASLVLLAAPVLSLAGLLRRIAGKLAPTATVIDVAVSSSRSCLKRMRRCRVDVSWAATHGGG